MEQVQTFDVVIIGAGQSGLAVAYYMRRTGLNYVLLDANNTPGGSWQHYWPSLKLFSPALFSSLPGIIMPGGPDHYPTRQEVLQYLHDYEARYKVPIHRPVKVSAVSQPAPKGPFAIQTNKGTYQAKVVISATGSYANPHMPTLPGQENFQGTLIHSAQYHGPEPFQNKKVLVVGQGNSGAQILAEVSKVSQAQWVTLTAPTFMPDDVDGRYLFDVASQQYRNKQEGKQAPKPNLGNIVMVPSVKEARQRGVLEARRPFTAFWQKGVVWDDGQQEAIDAVIWATGFKPALQHLEPLNSGAPGTRFETAGTRALQVPGLWLVGYGSWTGFASATLIGVGRSARRTAQEVKEYFS